MGNDIRSAVCAKLSIPGEGDKIYKARLPKIKIMSKCCTTAFRRCANPRKLAQISPGVITDRLIYRVDEQTLVSTIDPDLNLSPVMDEGEHIDQSCEDRGAFGSSVDFIAIHGLARTERYDRASNDTRLVDSKTDITTSAATRSDQAHISPSVGDSSSSRSRPASLQSIILSAGCYTATDAFTTAPSADPLASESTGHETYTLTDFDTVTIGLPPNVNREYASVFARYLKEAVGITDDQTSLLIAPDSMLVDTLQTYASMLGTLPGTPHFTAVKFVHRQRK